MAQFCKFSIIHPQLDIGDNYKCIPAGSGPQCAFFIPLRVSKPISGMQQNYFLRSTRSFFFFNFLAVLAFKLMAQKQCG